MSCHCHNTRTSGIVPELFGVIVDELDGSNVLVHPRPLAALEDVLALVMFVEPVKFRTFLIWVVHM